MAGLAPAIHVCAYHTSSKSWMTGKKAGRGVSAYGSSQLCTASSITKVDVAWNPLARRMSGETAPELDCFRPAHRLQLSVELWAAGSLFLRQNSLFFEIFSLLCGVS
jgi:hypothetical protein